MNTDLENDYNHIRNGGTGFYESPRGLIAVWGKEAVQFLDGLISNDMKTLEDGHQILAAFPNAQGRLIAVVRVLRQGDRYLFDTEDTTREKVFQNLFRFTFAGDFFVDDLSENYKYLEIFGSEPEGIATGFQFDSASSIGRFAENDLSVDFRADLVGKDAIKISDNLYEVLRIEKGVPKYGVDMDETTIIPELGIDDLISYKKGCYIGQEIIARIYFRGHVAKRLAGLILSEPVTVGSELQSTDSKNAGRITSVTFSPKLGKNIALAFVRYDYLATGTELLSGAVTATVTDIPFIN